MFSKHSLCVVDSSRWLLCWASVLLLRNNLDGARPSWPSLWLVSEKHSEEEKEATLSWLFCLSLSLLNSGGSRVDRPLTFRDNRHVDTW